MKCWKTSKSAPQGKYYVLFELALHFANDDFDHMLFDDYFVPSMGYTKADLFQIRYLMDLFQSLYFFAYGHGITHAIQLTLGVYADNMRSHGSIGAVINHFKLNASFDYMTALMKFTGLTAAELEVRYEEMLPDPDFEAYGD
jgi:hypothetical protein